ncbi:DNA-binding transcriptional regulator, MarR family [Salinihabitans flavidus]|uniref:DNA-binding transcriptional regulator, MarR family n=1 Tax=Salinihabitans flavidus TaxID=569882 RepID=A0A1H8PAU6_9RHOB|nr:MarR family winged helix-turn-helix transcriptional regulator [Salinihabitans flavidus]SEO38887.1 DNA-binding transcriptional regulator, MarR family [Salinihabitans flavidus]
MHTTETKKRPGTKPRVHPPITTLMDALSFRIARLAAINEKAGNALFREQFGLTLTEWRVLGVTQAMQCVPFNQLYRYLVMDKGQLSRTVKALGKRDLIEILPSETDARQIQIRTTQAGRDLHDRALVYTQERNEVTVETLTPEECAEFMRILKKISTDNEDRAFMSGVLK